MIRLISPAILLLSLAALTAPSAFAQNDFSDWPPTDEPARGPDETWGPGPSTPPPQEEPRAESSAPSHREWGEWGAWDARASIGLSREAYTETIKAVATETNGLWALPRGEAELRFTPATAPDWRFAGFFQLSGTPPLNGVNFPVSYGFGARAERHGLAGVPPVLSPFVQASFEHFSQVSAAFPKAVSSLLYVARTTSVLWLEPGVRLDADWIGRWLEAWAGLLLSPYGWSSAPFQTEQTVRGFGLDLGAAVGLTEHLFVEVPVRVIALDVGLSITGSSAGVNVGWKF